jgi:hypothetical protein
MLLVKRKLSYTAITRDTQNIDREKRAQVRPPEQNLNGTSAPPQVNGEAEPSPQYFSKLDHWKAQWEGTRQLGRQNCVEHISNPLVRWCIFRMTT